MAATSLRDGTAAPTDGGSRALVVISPRIAGSRDDRREAGFVAQLIACALRLPAYRRAGRIAPAGAAGRYEARPPARPRPGLDVSV